MNIRSIILYPIWIITAGLKPLLPEKHLFKNLAFKEFKDTANDLAINLGLMLWISGIFMSCGIILLLKRFI